MNKRKLIDFKEDIKELTEEEKKFVAEYEYIANLPSGSKRPRFKKGKYKAIMTISHKVFGIVMARHFKETMNRPGLTRRLTEKH